METEFADHLNQLLLKADRSASWLARRLHLAPSTVSRWLDGSTLPDSVMRVEDILIALHIDHPEGRACLLASYRYWWRHRGDLGGIR